MHMRPGGFSCHAHIGDNIALMNLLPYLDNIGIVVCINGRKTATMLQNDDLAASIGPTGMTDDAIGGSMNRRFHAA